ncbi:phosphoglycerate kinase [bacterium]|nr:phosphoglycerate kinase [candidate division CSSED10-310 bacterium]
MAGKRSINDTVLTGKRVFMRVDFNVPIRNGQVADDNRIQAALPSIQTVIRQKGKLILASHLGEPKNGFEAAFSLKPVAEKLQDILKQPVSMAGDCIGDAVQEAVLGMKDGDVLMLENLRFHSGEKKNDPVFSASLSKNIDVYVNNAFGTCHRAHASIVGVPQLVKDSAAGDLVIKEIQYLDTAIRDPKRPLIAILGGAKVSGKLALIKNLLPKVDGFLIGGAMAFTFLKAMGYDVGGSLVEDDLIEVALEILDLASEDGKLFLLPSDAVVARYAEPGVAVKIVSISDIPPEMKGFDIGPDTIRQFGEEISHAGTIVWNGPMGMFEIAEFASGTFELARCVAASSAISIVGGGDSASAIKKAGVANQITHLSTGGGASLEYLEGKILPGIAVLPDA